MPFDISEFMANAGQFGFTRPAYFLVQIPAPPQFYNGDTRFVSFLCHATTLPGVSILTSDERRWGYGPTKKVPFALAHTDINLTIYSDGAGMAIDFFDQWVRNISSFGSLHTPIQGAMYGQQQYPEQYETDLEILYFNENPGPYGRELITYRMLDAYPTGMSEIALDWNALDQYSIITVPMTFRTYQIEVNDAGGFGDDYAINRDPNYLLNVAGGFSGLNMTMSGMFQQAESLTSGSIGFNVNVPGFSGVLNSITSGSTSIGDKLNLVAALNGSSGFVGGGIQFP